MVKHTQTIRRQTADELFGCVWPFCEAGAYKVNELSHHIETVQLAGFCIPVTLLIQVSIDMLVEEEDYTGCNPGGNTIFKTPIKTLQSCTLNSNHLVNIKITKALVSFQYLYCLLKTNKLI